MVIKMKIAIIGSRGITDINLSEYVPDNITEIISGEQRVSTLWRENMHSHTKSN